jgi:hypothetical protein
MTPERQIPAEIRQLLARARPEQIARLLRDVKTPEPTNA